MGSHGRFLLVALLASGCLSSPPDGGGPSEVEPDCGTLDSLSDDFVLGLSPWRWAPEGLWSAENESIRLTPSPATLSAIYSRQSWTVDGGDLVVQLDASQMAEGSLLQVWLTGDADHKVNLALEDATLHANVQEPGFTGSRGSIAFTDDMRWWRIGRSGERFHWAVSTDGDHWMELGEFDAELSGPVQVSILHLAQSAESVVMVESINPDGATQPTCPVASLVDDFSHASPRWEVEADPGCSVAFNGRAELTLSSTGVCSLASLERFSLVESAVSVELADPGDCATTPTFEVAFDGGFFSFECRPGPPRLYAMSGSDTGASELGYADWNPEDLRFLQLRHAEGEGGLIYETSSDREGWNQMAIASDLSGFDLGSVAVSFRIYLDAPGGGRSAFDELNTAP